jgi:tetratricopeptide (TPR) repeat protein
MDGRDESEEASGAQPARPRPFASGADDALARAEEASAGTAAVAVDETATAGVGSGRPRPRVGAKHLARGDSLGRYFIVDQLGEGGMGVVYKAYDPDLDRKLALKLLHPSLGAAAPEARARLLREARAMARLNHPNVITVHEVGSVADRDFVAMELVDGPTLGEWVGQRKNDAQRGVPAILDAFVQAGRGLAAAHAAGLIHRDFKPSNVLVGADGRFRVTDFGLARKIADLAGADAPAPRRIDLSLPGVAASQPADALTRTGALVGTPAYMAPEQLLGEAIDERTDQFSFCVALYEALHGQRPFPGDTFDALKQAVGAGQLGDEPAGADIPARVREALRRGLSRTPTDRFPTMDALLAELAVPTAPRRRWVWLGAAAILVVGAALALWTRANEATPCGDAERKLAGIWDAERKRHIRLAFTMTKLPYAQEAYAGFERVVDDYALAWVAMHTQACQANAKGRESEEVYFLRLSCLQQHRAELESLAAVYAHADARAVEQAVQSAHELPAIATCGDVESLRRGVPPPSDPEVRARVDALRAKLAESKTRGEAGMQADALRLAEEAVAEARPLEYRPVLAEALHQLGVARSQDGRTSQARAAFREAILVAIETGHEAIWAEALVGDTLVVATFSSQFEEARELGRQAKAVIKRYGRDRTMEGKLNLAMAHVMTQEHESPEALALLDETLALYEREIPDDHARIGAVHGAIADVHEASGRFDLGLASAERELAGYERAHGADHPDVIRAVEKVGAWLSATGQYDRERAAFARSRRFWQSERGREILGQSEAAAPLVRGTRTVRGRVVDAAGAPVAGAEVAVATLLYGNGKHAVTSKGITWDRASGLVLAHTDEQGAFELAQVSDKASYVIAEHDPGGRSWPVAIASGAASPAALELRLRSFGAVRGRVTTEGPLAGGGIVVALPVIADRGRGVLIAVVVATDGSYVFERLPAGDYELMFAMGRGNIEIKASATGKVTVRPGETATVDFAVAAGGISLGVDVRGTGGVAIPSTQILLVEGTIEAATVGQLNRTVLAGAAFKAGFALAGKPAVFDTLTPGSYSVCAIPLAGDFRDPDFMRTIEDKTEDLAVHCRPLTVAATPAAQSFVATVPPMTPPAPAPAMALPSR